MEDNKPKYNVGDKVHLSYPGYPIYMYNCIGTIINGCMQDPWGNPEYGIKFTVSREDVGFHRIVPEEHISRII